MSDSYANERSAALVPADVADVIETVDGIVFDISKRHLSDLERIVIEHCLQNKSYKEIAQISAWSEGHIRNIAQKLWRILETKFQTPINKQTIQGTLIRYQNSSNSKHWGNAPDVTIFFGRERELNILDQWILNDRCRLVGIFGLGGVGKTNLVTKFALDIQQQFDYIIWYELINTPPITDTLSVLNQFLFDSPKDDDSRLCVTPLSKFIYCLQQKRCLVVLDNFESVLQGQNLSSDFLEGYEGYGQLLQQVGEVVHQSCIVITSREKPRNISILERKDGPTRSIELSGLPESEGIKVFDSIGEFSGLEQHWSQLNAFYNGNPLALKLVAKHIQEVFNGDVLTFNEHGKSVFYDISHLLGWHLQRMSIHERQLAILLAISRVPMTFGQLRSHLLSISAQDDLANTLQSLRRRLPIELRSNGFTLQPVLMEYFREKFVAQVVQEIKQAEVDVLNQYAILHASSEEYIKESQSRVIISPILKHLLEQLHTSENIEGQLALLLSQIQDSPSLRSGYASGNILNLLCTLKQPLSDYDFSQVTIRQADLQGKRIYNVNFEQTCFKKSTFSQNFSGIHGLSFSPDGQLLAAAGTDGCIIIFKVDDGQRLLLLQHDQSKFSWVPGIVFHPNLPLLASAGFNQQIKLWDFQTGDHIRTFQGHTSWIWSIAFNPDGQLLASAGDDHSIRVWDVHTGECLHVIEAHPRQVQSVKFSPNGKYLASSGYDQVIRLWDIATWTCTKTLKGHQSVVGDVSFNSDSSILMSVSADTTARLWDVKTGECIRVLSGHPDAVRSGIFCQDHRVASGGLNGNIRIWDVTSGQCIYNLQAHTDWVRVMAASPCGEIVASGDLDQTIKLWNINTGQCIRTIHGHCTWSWAIAFHPSGRTLASGHLDKTVRFWDIASGQCTHTLQGHRGWIPTLAYHPNGQIIASGSFDSTIRIWDASTGHCITKLSAHPLGVRSLSFSPNGQILASSGDDSLINIWRVDDWKHVRTLNGHEGWVGAISFGDNSELLVSCSDDNTIKLWEVSIGECIQSISSKVSLGRAPSMMLRPTGEVIVSGDCSQPIQIWNILTGEFLGFIPDHNNNIYTTFVLSPNASTLALSGDSPTIQIRSPYQNQSTQTLDEHDSIVMKLAFSTDGNQLASASLDESIKIWDLKSGTCVQTLKFIKPYERISIQGTTGITDAQKAALLYLGAVEN